MDTRQIENDPELKAAEAKLASVQKDRDAAAKRLDKLRSGEPAGPPLLRRAKAWLSGGGTALEEETASQAEIDEAADDLAVLEQAVELQKTIAVKARETATRAFLESKVPEYHRLAHELADALQAAANAIAAERVFFFDAARIAGGEANSPLSRLTIDHQLGVRVAHVAKEYRALIAQRLGGK